MKRQLPLPALAAALVLGGCVSVSDWSEAPGSPYTASAVGYPIGYAEAPWWGRDAASVDLFIQPLVPYGRWGSHAYYGRIWLPAGVGPGWQPYSRGHWAQGSYGRRWVSAEPFGWATHHYGRWGHDARLGWFWVPDTRFGGAWVDWRDGPGYAGWAPLPPYGWDRYGGRADIWYVYAPYNHLWHPGLDRHSWRGRPPGAHHAGPGQPGRPHDGRPGKPDRPKEETAERPAGNGWQAGRPPQGRPGERGYPGFQRQTIAPAPVGKLAATDTRPAAAPRVADAAPVQQAAPDAAPRTERTQAQRSQPGRSGSSLPSRPPRDRHPDR